MITINERLQAAMTGEMRGHQVYYITPTGRKKYKHFDNMEQVEVWCKRNKTRVRIHSDSWQVFAMMDKVKGIDNELTHSIA